MKRRDFCKALVCSAALAPGLALPRAEAAAKSQTVGRAVPAGNYTMSFRSELSQMDIEHEYYYSDSFFAHTSVQYDHQLALATLGMVTAAFNTWASDAKYWANGDVGRENSLDAAYTKLGFGDYDLDDIIDEYDRCGAFRTNHKVMARFVRNSGEMLDHLLSLIPADSDILDPDQYNIHQAYGNPSYPIVRGGYRTWASTIQFRGKVVTTRDVNYPVGKFSRLKDICAIVLRRTQELERQKGVLCGFVLIVLGIASSALSKTTGGTDVQDFFSGILMGLSVVEILAGIWTAGKALLKQ